MKLSGVPSSGLTNTMSLGFRRDVSIERKTTGSSRIFGCACTVPRLKKSNSPLELGSRRFFPTQSPTQFHQGDILDLTDSLPRHSKLFTDFFEGPRSGTV